VLKETLLSEGITKIRNYKYRIYPTDEQQSVLSEWFGMCRFVYNKHLAIDKQYYEANRANRFHPKSLSYVQMCSYVTILRNGELSDWLSQCPIDALQNSLRNYQSARKNFFRDPGRVGYPRFKSRFDNKQTISFNQAVHVTCDCVKIPKLPPIKIKLHRPLVGEVKTVRIIRNADNTWDTVVTVRQGQYQRPKLVSVVAKWEQKN